MGSLTKRRIAQLTRVMDERFDRELQEIDAILARSRAERDQARLAGRPADELDAVLTDVAAALDDAMVRQNVQDVRDILAARRRIAAGRYGVCIDCGSDIAFARLQAYPTAKRCIDCQRAHEAAAARGGSRRALAG